MKMNLKCLNFLLVFFLILPVVTLSSCGKKDNNPTTVTPTPAAPVIAAISPESGKPADVITINGTGFGTDKAKVKVLFESQEATTIVSVKDTEIKVNAPAGFSNQTVKVVVYIANVASNQKSFNYTDTSSPTISSANASCFYGSTVIIVGNNFSENKADNIVKFGEVEATVIAASKTSLTVIAPNLGSAATANITVNKLGMVSNARSIAVDADQNLVATYNWTSHTARAGVVYKTGQFNLFGSARRINVLDVTLNASNTLGIGFSTSNKSTVAMCNDYGAIVGINAGYFPMSGASDKDPYIRINSVKMQDGHLNVNPIFTNAALTINNNIASIRNITTGGRNQNPEAAAIPVAEAQNVIVCGPMLIKNGIIENLDMTNSHNSSSTARTALGLTADGKRLFMVVVDYNSGVTGLSTLNVAKILQALGAVNAMNFDGGGSSTMFVQGKGDNGRVSVNGSSMRAIRSVIYVK
ncbi:phosphodiester glycosidase family protein [Pedobacter sp. UBA4863]|uniref:phosphodiester glycosidase family protein n=1 Tax=Pedobacter sp. UBA4863 TaxID=1947060 RepID=UPI0025F3858B|nr:phosphodiester glycosidase family protein [Pedobacter sp. UBA4863]